MIAGNPNSSMHRIKSLSNDINTALKHCSEVALLNQSLGNLCSKQAQLGLLSQLRFCLNTYANIHLQLLG